MKFEDIVKRLTGISTPFFGVSWNPPEAERDIARRIIAFMEDRRVLYAPSEMEVPQHCVDSVIHIREFLTDEIGKLETDKEIAKSLRAMRAACRKFLSRVGGDKKGEILMYGGMCQGFATTPVKRLRKIRLNGWVDPDRIRRSLNHRFPARKTLRKLSISSG